MDVLEELEKEVHEIRELEKEAIESKDDINEVYVELLDDKQHTNWCHGKLRLLNPPGPLTALASFPGSGNTWLRYLLQQASGYATGLALH